jgi:hypothetical protein
MRRSGRGEAGDQRVERVAPEALGIRGERVAAELCPRDSFSQRTELRRCLGDTPSAEETCLVEGRETRVENSERLDRGGPEAAPDRRIGVMECDREQRRVFEREVPEDERYLYEVIGWLVGGRQRLDGRRLTDAERERFARLPDVEVEEWTGDGHFVHLVDPDRFATRLRRFVERCSV